MRHTGLMDTERRLAHLHADGNRLIEIASGAPSAPVPSCPGWDNTKLMVHCGRVWHSVALHVERLVTEMVPRSEVPVPDKGGEVEYAREAFAHVEGALRSADPAASVWAWAGDGTVGFYVRRMHQETLVHRIDAEQAAGVESDVDVADAADGVDELVRVLLPVRASEPPSGTLHLHQTDGPGEWMLATVDGRVSATLGHDKGDAAVRAGAADLLLAMWQRRPLDGLEIFGDRSIAEEWMALSA